MLFKKPYTEHLRSSWGMEYTFLSKQQNKTYSRLFNRKKNRIQKTVEQYLYSDRRQLQPTVNALSSETITGGMGNH